MNILVIIIRVDHDSIHLLLWHLTQDWLRSRSNRFVRVFEFTLLLLLDLESEFPEFVSLLLLLQKQSHSGHYPHRPFNDQRTQSLQLLLHNQGVIHAGWSVCHLHHLVQHAVYYLHEAQTLRVVGVKEHPYTLGVTLTAQQYTVVLVLVVLGNKVLDH